ncbi:MAG TPA: glycosyltransferase, partial [Solirubrobacterales bacterium]
WRAVHGVDAPAEWDRYREEMAAGLEGVDAIVAPTRAMLRALEHDHDLRPGTATVIHNGSTMPTGLTPPYIDGNRPVGRVVGGKQPLVLGSGRFWDPAKNLAALDVAAEGLAWPVVVAGDLGPEAGTRHAESAGLLPPAALADLRRSAAIYASPALYEPFGLGILEAALDGCALVLGDIPSLRELWDGAAIFIDPRKPHGLHEALKTLIDEGALRADLAQRAQRRAAAYSIQHTARAYRHLYEGLVRTGKEVLHS